MLVQRHGGKCIWRQRKKRKVESVGVRVDTLNVGMRRKVDVLCRRVARLARLETNYTVILKEEYAKYVAEVGNKGPIHN